MISRVGFVVIALLSGTSMDPVAAQVNEAQSDTSRLLNEGLNSIDESYRGTHRSFNDDIIGQFFSMMASGAVDQAMLMEAQVCDAWQRRPPDFPLTGNASVFGVEISLEEMCGTQP